jgi:serine palmitoyltransferase
MAVGEALKSVVGTMLGAGSDFVTVVRSTMFYRLDNLFTFKGYTSLLEGLIPALFLYLAFTRAYLPRRTRNGRTTGQPQLDNAEIEQKIRDWQPEPLEMPEFLVDPVPSVEPERIVLTSAAGPTVSVLGVEGAVANFSSCNFLGLVGHPAIVGECKKTMQTYGCGACGPRGFYGTVDVHLQCEAALAKYMGVEDAILYSFGSATGSSVVPAFCKRGDVVVCDKGIGFSLQTGVNLSRADVRWFEHNDMADLERVLKEVTAGDKSKPSLALQQRRFIIVEGVYANYGDIAPLNRIVDLKEKYLFRLILDESMSLGVLGASGRGALEHFNVDRADVEIAIADLANAFATVGGVCVGERAVVSHQRLSGAGYCFSAAQPPFLATAATEAVKVLETCGAGLVNQCRTNVTAFRRSLNMPALREAGWHVDGDTLSPLMHIRAEPGRTVPESVFFKIQQACIAENVLIAAPRYVSAETFQPAPSIRISVSAAHDIAMIENAARVICKVLIASSAGTQS